MTRTTKRGTRLLALLVVIAMVLVTGCSEKKKSDDSPSEGGKSGALRISSQGFSESQTLAEVYGQYLDSKGFKVDIQPSIGARAQIYQAFDSGSVDLVIEYVGDAANEVSKGAGTNDAKKSYKALVKGLDERDLKAGKMGKAADATALVALKSWAEANGVTKVSDLKVFDKAVTLGGLAECADRPVCLKGYNGKPYGLSLKFKLVEYGPAMVAALKSNDIQVAQYGSTAPEIAKGEIVVLEDDKGLQAAGNIVPVYRSAVSDKKLTAALDELTAKITTNDLIQWNKGTDLDKDEPADVAKAWLKDKGLT